MKSQDSFVIKNRICYYAGLSLLLSWLELLIPNPVPFFRIGLANALILKALSFSFSDFCRIVLIKTFCVCLLNGTLFSPFFVMSFLQSVCSAGIMYILKRILKEKISLTGCSLAGAQTSTFVQLGCICFYLKLPFYKTGFYMALFSIFAALITAFIAQNLSVNEKDIPVIQAPEQNQPSGPVFLFLAPAIVVNILIFKSNSLLLLSVLFTGILIIQLLLKIKISVKHYFFLWIFILISGLFVPEGKVLFKILNLPVTQESLYSGILKSLRLSISMAVSMCCTKIRFPYNSWTFLTFAHYKRLVRLRESS